MIVDVVWIAGPDKTDPQFPFRAEAFGKPSFPDLLARLFRLRQITQPGRNGIEPRLKGERQRGDRAMQIESW